MQEPVITDPEPRVSPPKKPSPLPKILAIGCGGLIALCVLITLVYMIFVPKETKDRLARERGERARADSIQASSATGKPPRSRSEDAYRKEVPAAEETRRGGLSVARAKLVDLFAQKEFGFTFEESKLASGERRVIGKSDIIKLSLLEFTGPEEELSKAYGAWFISNDEEQNGLAGIALIALANAIDKEAGAWVTDQIGNIQAHDSRAARTINGRRYTLTLTTGTLARAELIVEPAS